jgi:hypothetical protein
MINDHEARKIIKEYVNWHMNIMPAHIAIVTWLVTE